MLIDSFISKWQDSISEAEYNFLRRGLKRDKWIFARFYLTAKLHKNPYKFRKIETYGYEWSRKHQWYPDCFKTIYTFHNYLHFWKFVLTFGLYQIWIFSKKEIYAKYYSKHILFYVFIICGKQSRENFSEIDRRTCRWLFFVRFNYKPCDLLWIQGFHWWKMYSSKKILCKICSPV